MRPILKIIILIGIFTLPLINSRITELLWFSFSIPVNWNFEFTKVMFFNIWSSIVIGLFFTNNIISRVWMHSYWNIWQTLKTEWKYSFPTILLIFYIILILSTFFSTSPYISFFWNEIKSHSFIMWSNLVWLFLVLSSLTPNPSPLEEKGIEKNNFFSKMIGTFIFSWVFVSIIWLKEYFFPTFDYWNLWSRLFSTFWHPNYVSIFLVSLMPFLYNYKPHLTSPFRRGIKIIILALFWVTLLFTKSVFAIFLFLCFNIWYFYSQFAASFLLAKRKEFKIGMLMFVIVIVSYMLFKFAPEKLHSFISRYFIWETSVNIIFSDVKIFFLWWGTETFVYFFDNFKSEYLYIFENLWFSADRPHNIILNFFYHFWIWGLIFIVWIYYYAFKSIYSGWTQGITPTKISLILILSFLLLNPTSIVLYLLVVILLAYDIKYDNTFLLSKRKSPKGDWVMKEIFILQKIKILCWKFLFWVITIVSIFWAYSSYNFYYSETKVYNSQPLQAINIYKYNPNNYFYNWELAKWLSISKIRTREYYYVKIQVSQNKEKVCNEFTKKHNFSESYFFCWNYFWNIWNKDLAKNYYNSWLKLLPDLWNKKSQYYDKFLVKNLKINWNRFLSKKYWLAQILERVWIINK